MGFIEVGSMRKISLFIAMSLVLHPARNYNDSTAYFAICRVVVSQRRNHSASLLRLAD